MELKAEVHLQMIFGVAASVPIKIALCNHRSRILQQDLCVFWQWLWQKITFLSGLDAVLCSHLAWLQGIRLLCVLDLMDLDVDTHK